MKVLHIPFVRESEDSNNDNVPASIVPPTNSSEKPFVFLVVFDFLSFVQRKNPEAAIRAFLDAFPSDTHRYDVQLIVKTHSGTPEEISNLNSVAKGDPRVLFIHKNIDDSENIALHKYPDCYVSLHRSEGYGMNILESLGQGIPAIATNYSGNVDIFEALPKSMENVCFFPISYELRELEEDYGPYTRGNHWAEADHSSAVLAMRKAFQSKCKTNFGQEMSNIIELHFGLAAIGHKMKEHLKDSRPHILEKFRK